MEKQMRKMRKTWRTWRNMENWKKKNEKIRGNEGEKREASKGYLPRRLEKCFFQKKKKSTEMVKQLRPKMGFVRGFFTAFDVCSAPKVWAKTLDDGAAVNHFDASSGSSGHWQPRPELTCASQMRRPTG